LVEEAYVGFVVGKIFIMCHVGHYDDAHIFFN
jgi:hypothetical protein